MNDVDERLAQVRAHLETVLSELATDTLPIHCKAEGLLAAALMAVIEAKELL